MSRVIVYDPIQIQDLEIFEAGIQADVRKLKWQFRKTLAADLVDLVDGTTQRVGIVFHNVANKCLPPFFQEYEVADEEARELVLQTNDRYRDIFGQGFRETVGKLREKIGHSFAIDLLSCKLDLEGMAESVAELESDYDVNVTYSLNDTGPVPNGDWIMESDNTDVKPFQFNDSISNWNHVLTAKVDSNNQGSVTGLSYDAGTKTYTLTQDITWSATGDLSALTDGSSLSYFELDEGETFNGNGYTITVPGGEYTSGLFTTTASVSNYSVAPTISNLRVVNLSGINTQSNAVLLKNTTKYIRVNKVEIESDMILNRTGFVVYYPGLSNGVGTFSNISLIQNNDYVDNTQYSDSGLFSGQWFGRYAQYAHVENVHITTAGDGGKNSLSLFGITCARDGGKLFIKNVHFRHSNSNGGYHIMRNILANANTNTRVYLSNIIFDAPGTANAFGSALGYGGSQGRGYINNIILGSNASVPLSLINSENYGANCQLYMNNIQAINSSVSNLLRDIRNPANFSVFQVDGVAIRPTYNATTASNISKLPTTDITNQLDTGNQYTATYTDASGNATGFESNDWIVGTAGTGTYPRLQALTESPWSDSYYTGFTISGKIDFTSVAPDIILTAESISTVQSLTYSSGTTSNLSFSSGTGPNTKGITSLGIQATPTGSANIDFVVNSNQPAVEGNFIGAALGFDVSANLADFNGGSIDITLTYDSNIFTSLGITSNDASKMKFLHYNSNTSSWESVTTTVNTSTNTITGTFTSLSPVDIGMVIKRGQYLQKSSTPLIISGTGQVTVRNSYT